MGMDKVRSPLDSTTTHSVKLFTEAACRNQIRFQLRGVAWTASKCITLLLASYASQATTRLTMMTVISALLSGRRVDLNYHLHRAHRSRPCRSSRQCPLPTHPRLQRSRPFAAANEPQESVTGCCQPITPGRREPVPVHWPAVCPRRTLDCRRSSVRQLPEAMAIPTERTRHGAPSLCMADQPLQLQCRFRPLLAHRLQMQ